MADTTIPVVAGDQLAIEDQAYREMRTRLDSMGPVNMMALEEYKESAERHQFLDTQRKDLLDSIENTTATIKEIDHDRIIRTVPRAQLRRALTPQCFRFDILKRAYADLEEIESLRIDVTDDSFLVERLGVPITIVKGSARNIKITNQDDLAFAETVLRSVVSRR